MTVQEVIRIKRLLEGNFLKVKEMDDNVFVAAFNEYDFEMMQIACMQYIKKCKFQPTIANILEEYEQVLQSKKTEIVKLMNTQGWFYHSTEYEKALSWVKRDIIPEWFKNMMIEFINQNKQLKTQKTVDTVNKNQKSEGVKLLETIAEKRLKKRGMKDKYSFY